MISFVVEGHPETKGSTKAFRAPRTGRIIVKNDNDRCKPWQEAIGWSARAAMRSEPPMTGPVTIEAVFRFDRPKSTKLHAPRLDVDKLLRALLDGMTRIVYVDDKQVAQVHVRKEWTVPGGSPGVSVTASEVPAIGATP